MAPLALWGTGYGGAYWCAAIVLSHAPVQHGSIVLTSNTDVQPLDQAANTRQQGQLVRGPTCKQSLQVAALIFVSEQWG